jgi:hypothetical protein
MSGFSNPVTTLPTLSVTGPITVSGVATLSGGSNSLAGFSVTASGFVSSGVGFVPNATRDGYLYLAFALAGTITLSVGGGTVFPAGTAVIAAPLGGIFVPAGAPVVLTLVTATLASSSFTVA